jgi:hypothetical protein
MHQVYRISKTETILEKSQKFILSPCFSDVVHQIKDSLKNNYFLYFINKHIQRLYYQLFPFILYGVFVIFVFYSSIKPATTRGEIQLVG